MLVYTAAAVIFLVLLLGLRGKRRSHESEGDPAAGQTAASLWRGRWLELSERIFDPSDARWIEEELAFPQLAKSLVSSRKLLAIRWLEALHASFEQAVRVRETLPADAPAAESAGGWQMLWLTLRFKFLVSYALLIVRVFGPYHRLIPSFSWVPALQGGEGAFHRTAPAAYRASR